MKQQFILKATRVAVMAALAGWLPNIAFAENKAEVLEIGKVEVVGTTPLGGLGVPIEQVPSGVQVSKGDVLQQQQNLGVADFMNQNLAGVNINEAQNNPYQPDVNFHGYTASPLLGTAQGLSVYQDGVRINEPFGDTVNWDLIPQNAISSITLMPGSNPLFGLNTLGGALSVQTKEGEHFPGGGVQAYGGSFGRWAVEGEHGGKLGTNGSYFVAFNKFEEDGWRDDSPSDVRQAFAKLGWSDEKTDIDVSFAAADTDLTGNGFQAQSLMKALGYDSIYTKPDNTANKMSFINGKASTWLSDDFLLTGNAYYRHNRTKTLNGDVSDEYEAFYEACDELGNSAIDCTALYDHGVNNRSSVTNKSYGVSTQLSWMTDRNLLVTGVSIDFGKTKYIQTEQEAEEFNARRGFDVDALDDEIEDINDLTGKSRAWSLFITDTFNVTPKMAVTVSGRYNHINSRVTDHQYLAGHKEATCIENATGEIAEECDGSNNQTEVLQAAGDAGGNHTWTRFNPALGVTYAFTPELNAYAGYNEGNRAPSPIETGCADPAFPCLLPNAMAGDPPLKQVVAKTWEAGARGKVGNTTRWSVAAYHATNHDDLQFIASGTTGAGYFGNVGKTQRQGLDFGLAGALGDFNWSAGYSYIDATYESSFNMASEANSSRNDDDQITVSKGDEMAGIPKHQLKLRGEWRVTPNWSIGSTVTAFSDQWVRGNENNKHRALTAEESLDGNDYAGSGKVAGYAVVNLDTRYNFNNSGWQLFGKVNNVFDQEYSTGGLLGENSFTAAGSTFATDAESSKELFVAPGAPRAAWIGLRYDFGGAKATAAVDRD